MENLLDLSTANEYDLIVSKDRTLNSNITCTFKDASGNTQYFDFSTYLSGLLVVKNQAGTTLLTFTTADNSMTFLTNGVFNLSKTAAEMDVVRAGCYLYDMYITSGGYPKRGFLRGKITFIQNIAN